mmetsp:Transcript_2746/g.9262  ORF Transcript_2746/g.9262 Transcript_2746/m.9262 type:complete len:333 (-) Transcript_2746:302-1300(-)
MPPQAGLEQRAHVARCLRSLLRQPSAERGPRTVTDVHFPRSEYHSLASSVTSARSTGADSRVEGSAIGAQQQQGDALVAHQGQEVVVVHDGVRGPDPRRADVAVEDGPLVKVAGPVAVHLLAHVANDGRHGAVPPLLALGHGAVELVRGHGREGNLPPKAVPARGTQRLHERTPGLRLAAARRPDGEAAMPHRQHVQQAHHLGHEAGLRLQAAAAHGCGAGALEGRVAEGLWERPGEEAVDEARDDGQVLRRDLGRVEAPERAAEHRVRVGTGLAALQGAHLAQQRLHRAESPVVVRLLGKGAPGRGRKGSRTPAPGAAWPGSRRTSACSRK